jgi:CDP-glycerol glycerophosphotransferase
MIFGRLSSEQEQAGLIRAIARVHREFPDVRFLLAEQDPLRHELQALVAAQGLGGVVFLPEQAGNPYPLMNRADCCVLAANGEAQAMVLLEALALGKPVIAADFDEFREVLEDGFGLLVENSDDGLVEGMTLFLRGQLAFKPFAAVEYQEKAMRMFYENVCGEERAHG